MLSKTNNYYELLLVLIFSRSKSKMLEDYFLSMVMEIKELNIKGDIKKRGTMEKEKKEEETEIIRLLGEKEFREKETPLSKAVYLVESNATSIRKAALREGVSKKSVEKAILAVKEGRPIQKKGRPPLLTKEQDDQLASWVKERSLLNAFPSFEELVKKVVIRIYIINLISVMQFLSTHSFYNTHVP